MTVAPPKAIAGEYGFRISGLLKFEPGERPLHAFDILRRNAGAMVAYLDGELSAARS